MDLHGKRVLITGASRGIGEAIAREMATRGAVVAAVARDAAKLDALVAEIGGTAHPTDLLDTERVSTLIDRVEDEAGPVDVLVNNAGVGIGAEFATQSPEDVENLFRVNLITPVELCRQVLPRMERRGRGHIVNISSMAGAAAFGGLVTYGSSKAGLTQFTQTLALEMRKSPIGFTVVQLGPVPTDMLDQVDDYAPTADSFGRLYKLRLIVDVPASEVAVDVADAVAKGRRFVRHPKRAALFPMMTNFAPWVMQRMLIGVKQR